jgi:hypothetical protein
MTKPIPDKMTNNRMITGSIIIIVVVVVVVVVILSQSFKVLCHIQ